MPYSLLKPILFKLDPETAHDFMLTVARLSPYLGNLSGSCYDKRLSVKIGNIHWPFPIGLAAGLDKNAEALSFFSKQGFGSIECGTITLRPQLGNPKPRIFRYPDEKSLRNAMGFPNHGLLKIYPHLRAYDAEVPIGANIGKNKDSTADESIEELSTLFDTLESVVDYFVINVSSPNTPGLRALQEKSYLSELFQTLNESRKRTPKDLYLKIAPDLDEAKVKELSLLASDMKLTGIIATNTTIMPDRGIGGISGNLLKEKSRKVRKVILEENLPIELIGVGGFSEPSDLFEFWAQGGKVAQLYTSYVYQGPDILKRFKQSILQFLQESNLQSLEFFFTLDIKERQSLLRKILIG